MRKKYAVDRIAAVNPRTRLSVLSEGNFNKKASAKAMVTPSTEVANIKAVSVVVRYCFTSSSSKLGCVSSTVTVEVQGNNS